MFVHGEKQRMETLRKFVRNKFKGIPVHMPPNGVVLLVNTSGTVKLKIGVDMLRKHINMHESRQNVNLVLKLSREGDEFNVLESKEFLEENREDK
ncbi:hypothetical protein PAEPH01_1612 [Pancytospora epiphaga]|nr:hypothetical protein PAEPH01_1612 [Pancytospora epiphaga]